MVANGMPGRQHLLRITGHLLDILANAEKCRLDIVLLEDRQYLGGIRDGAIIKGQRDFRDTGAAMSDDDGLPTGHLLLPAP